MRKHRLYGFGLALLTVVGAQAILQRPSGATNAAAPTHATGVGHPPLHGTHQFRSSLVADDAGSNSPGWNQITPGVQSDASSAAEAALAAADPTTPQPTGLGSQVQFQKLRALIATFRAEQFNALVATYNLQQYAASIAAGQAATAAAAQATQAAQAAPPAAAAPTTPTTTPATVTPPGGVWAALRQCESGDNYADDTGNGYYGAYQFALATWRGLGYSGLPSQAPPAIQDAAAAQLQARSGWGQWPACARHLGLL
jgi:hypothetical protein